MSAQGMPPQILSLFAPRLPAEFMPPLCYSGKKPVYDGIANLIQHFETTKPPPVPPFETPKERRERKKKEKLQESRAKQQELVAAYDPHAVDCATKNPYATLFVGRLSYETTEKKLRKEFECFGPIRKVKVITDFNGKSRGYGFIEYEAEEDLKTAYKQGDGKKIDGRRVLVDVERSRTVPGWTPRRLGGGRGPPRFVESKKKARMDANTGSSSYSLRNSWHGRSTVPAPGSTSGYSRDDRGRGDYYRGGGIGSSRYHDSHSYHQSSRNYNYDRRRSRSRGRPDRNRDDDRR